MIVLVKRGSGVAGQRGSWLQGEEHHLEVRRAQVGELVGIRDGFGLTGSGRLVRNGREWGVEVESAELVPRPADLVLAVGAGDRERFAWIVEKAVELGVTSVFPVETARTSGVATRIRAQHVPKIQRHAFEALKQCGAAWVPSVENPVPLGRFLLQPRRGDGWLADANGNPPPAVLTDTPVTVLVGPEGGFEDQESGAAAAAGYRPVCLGPYTLRFETAAIAAAAAVTAARQRGHHG